MSNTAMSARDAMEGTSLKVQEKTKGAIESVKRSGFVQQYILPVIDSLKVKYRRSPTVVKLTVMTFILLSAIPLACFVGFMGIVTLGCLIVGGIAFAIVEVSLLYDGTFLYVAVAAVTK